MAEALKFRFNQGKRSNLYFHRDAKGNEVDLLMIQGSDIFPIEIKGGMTLTGDFFKGLKYFANFFSDHMPWGSGLVYGGNESQQRTGVSIVPFQHLDRLFSQI
jgi:hypothetical protein